MMFRNEINHGTQQERIAMYGTFWTLLNHLAQPLRHKSFLGIFFLPSLSPQEYHFLQNIIKRSQFFIAAVEPLCHSHDAFNHSFPRLDSPCSQHGGSIHSRKARRYPKHPISPRRLHGWLCHLRNDLPSRYKKLRK